MAEESGAQRRIPPAGLCFGLLVGLLLLCVVGLAALELWHTRRQAVAQAERTSATLAHVIAEQTARTVQAVDLTLVGLRDALAAAPDLPADDARFRAAMRARLAELPYVRALFVIGPDGFITHDTDYPETPRVTLADRPYFRFHRDNSDLGLHVADPLISRSVGVWFVSMSRRVERPDGGFGGAVVAAVEPHYFERFYAGIDVGAGGNVVLLTRAGLLVARYPNHDAPIGASFASEEPFRSLLAGQTEGVYWSVSPVDGVLRAVGYRALAGAPLVVLSGVSEELALGQWRAHARALAAAAAALGALIVAVTVLVRQSLGRLKAERASLLRAAAERREAEEVRELLVRELNHRVKNTLAIVQAVADQIHRTGASPTEFQGAFLARLRALARAHDTLTREGWRGAALGDVVRGALEPFGAPAGGAPAPGMPARISAEGPPVRLNATAAVALAMALHELASNAAKHGALSAPGGQVRVAWTLDPAALELAWTEAGGPPVAGPSARRGFGSVLLERVVARQFGGELALDFAAGGLRCCVRLPTSRRLLAA